MKLAIYSIFLIFPFLLTAQSGMPDETDFQEIKDVLTVQQAAWNDGDLEAFMQGYWKSESLRFTSSGRTNKGWQKTLDGYTKAYPTDEKMGKLKFEIFDLYGVSEDVASLSGTFYLTRSMEDLSGYFSLIFRKIDGRWKIISDTTCSN